MTASRSVAFSIGYVVLHVLMDAGSYVQPVLKIGITPWNPQTGLLLAFLCLHSRGFVWAVIAQIVAEWLVRGIPSNLGVFLLQTVAVAGVYQLSAMLIRKLDMSVGRPTSATLIRFGLVAALSALAVSVLVVGLYTLSGSLPVIQAPSAIGKIWVGDLNGILMLTPLLLNYRYFPQGVRAAVAAPYKLLGVVAALLLAFVIVFIVGNPDDLRFFYVLFVPAIIAALAGEVMGVLLVAVAIQIGLVFGVQRLPEVAPLVDLQYLMLTLVATALALGVVVAERSNTAAVALRRETQLRDREASLARASRAATAGELASVLAHELNQPMTALVGYLRSLEIMLDKVVHSDSRLSPTVRKAADEALRVSDTLRRLRNFYAGRDPQIEPTEVDPLLRSIVDMMQRRGRVGSAAVEIDIEGELPRVDTDAVFVSVILSNLLSNSADALLGMTEGRIVVTTRSRGDVLEVAVEDNGPGVPDRLLPELFKAFVTTKTEGMGMGLAASKSLAQALGGDLTYERSIFGGARFVLSLPTLSNPS